MAINLTDSLNAATTKGKLGDAKQVYLNGDTKNLQQAYEETSTHFDTLDNRSTQMENAIQDISVTGGASTANAVSYNNSTSKLEAVTAQGAIDEVSSIVIYDVSARNNGAVFESLKSLLSSSNLNTLIPTSARRGGMAIRFIQGSEQSSDNNYIQFRCKSQLFSTNTEDWAFEGNDTLIENPEYIEVKTDKDGKVLEARKTDGTKVEYCSLNVRGKLINKDLQEQLSLKVNTEAGKSLIDADYASSQEAMENLEWLEVTTDKDGKVIEGINVNGEKALNIPLKKLNLTEAGMIALINDLKNHGIAADGVTQEELNERLLEYINTSIADGRYASKTIESVVSTHSNNISSLQTSINNEIHERETNENAIIASIQGGIGTVPAALLPVVSRSNPSSSNGATEEAIVNYVDAAKEYVTPEMYGAVGDGVTDDTQAIDDAILTGRVVLLKGTYLVHGISIQNNTTIIGGKIKATLKQNGHSSNLITAETSGINIVFKDVEFDGSASTHRKDTNADDYIIKVWYANSVSFIGCKIHNVTNGAMNEDRTEVAKRKGFSVSIYNTRNILIDSCEFYNIMQEGFSIGGYNVEDNYKEFVDVRIVNCYSHSNQQSQALFTIMNVKNMVVLNNVFTENNTSFFNLISNNCIFIGNIFDTSGKRGIGTEYYYWMRMRNIIIKSNIIRNTKDFAVQTGIDGCIVQGNTIENCRGIQCAGGVKNSKQYNQYWSNYIALICPFVTVRNTLDDEKGLIIDNNIIKLKDIDEVTDLTHALFIRGSYDDVNGDVSMAKNISITNNKIYNTYNKVFTIAPVYISNTDFTDILIKDNYIEGKLNRVDTGFITFVTEGTINLIKVVGNRFWSELENDMKNIVTITSIQKGLKDNIFIEDNISNHNFKILNQIGGTIKNTNIENNLVITF